MTKKLSKELTTRSSLTNNYLIDKIDEKRFLYSHQRNECIILLRNTKKNYYENLDEKDATDDKKL